MERLVAIFVFLIPLLVAKSAFALPDISNVNTRTVATNLELDGDGQTGTYTVLVADVTVDSPSAPSYTISIPAGDLTSGVAPVIGFQVAAVTSGSAPPTTFSSNWELCSSQEEDLDIYIQYTTATLQDPGTYTHSLFLSAVDNPGSC